MDILSVTDPGWVFPAVLVFLGTGFTVLAVIWVRRTRRLNRGIDRHLAELRIITARQFPQSVSAAQAAKEAEDQLKSPAELRRETLR